MVCTLCSCLHELLLSVLESLLSLFNLVVCTLCSCLHELLLSVLESLLSLFNIASLNCSQECLLSFLDVTSDSDVASSLLVDNLDSLLCGFNICH